MPDSDVIDWLRPHGVTDARITQAHAQIDQSRAWVRSAGLVALCARRAVDQGDIPHAARHEQELTRTISELTPDDWPLAIRVLLHANAQLTVLLATHAPHLVPDPDQN